MKKKVKYVCRECKNDNVSVDAYVDWNPITQEWTDIRAIFDEATCHECEGSTKLDEVELDADPAQVRVSNQESNNAS